MPRETLLAKRKVIKSCLPINYATNGIIALKNPLLALSLLFRNYWPLLDEMLHILPCYSFCFHIVREK